MTGAGSIVMSTVPEKGLPEADRAEKVMVVDPNRLRFGVKTRNPSMWSIAESIPGLELPDIWKLAICDAEFSSRKGRRLIDFRGEFSTTIWVGRDMDFVSGVTVTGNEPR